ncbi:MAG: NAD(P)H-binding protein [Pseudomonadota bacterium]
MSETVLILGATGRFGRAAAAAFHDAGWEVRVQMRSAVPHALPGRRVIADLDDSNMLDKAAAGAAVIVNALNPPYDKWTEEVPRTTDQVIALAQRSGAHVMIPGNVYNFGSNLPEVLSEATPEVGDHKKARIRIAMEAAYRASGVPTLVLRAGDFIDTHPGENWFEGQITAKLAQGRLVYPGPMDSVHAWAFLPDLARATVGLMARRDMLAQFQTVHFPGYNVTGAELARAVEAWVGPRSVRSMPWWALHLIAPFTPLMREVLDMRYLWQRPHRIDGALFHQLLPEFKATPLEQAVRASLEGTGHLAPLGHAVRTAA